MRLNSRYASRDIFASMGFILFACHTLYFVTVHRLRRNSNIRRKDKHHYRQSLCTNSCILFLGVRWNRLRLHNPIYWQQEPGIKGGALGSIRMVLCLHRYFVIQGSRARKDRPEYRNITGNRGISMGYTNGTHPKLLGHQVKT